MATHVNIITNNYPMSDDKLNFDRKATASDPTLQAQIGMN